MQNHRVLGFWLAWSMADQWPMKEDKAGMLSESISKARLARMKLRAKLAGQPKVYPSYDSTPSLVPLPFED